MAQTQTSTAVIANMQTQERFFDHFELEVWPGGLATPTFQQVVEVDQPGGSSLTYAYVLPNNVLFGSLLVYAVRDNGGLPATGVTDSRGNTWVKLYNTFWYALNCAAGPTTVTVTYASNNHEQGIIAEYSNVANLAPDASANIVGGTSNTATSASITPTVNGDLILAWAYNGTTNGPTYTAGAGFTLRSTGTHNACLEEQVQLTAAALTASLTINSSVAWDIGIVAFKASGAPQTSLVLGPYHIPGRWVAASGAWIQQDPLYVRGLTTGTTYAYRARVHIKSQGLPSPWTPFVQSTAGDLTPPSQSYIPSDSVTGSGVVIQSNPIAPSPDTAYYEFFTNTSGSLPSAAQPPNLPNSTDGSVRLLLGDLDTASVWIRAVDTSGNRQTWNFLGVFNSNGALIIAGGPGGAGSNLVGNPSFESARVAYQTGLRPASGQYVADGWVAASGSNAQFNLEVEVAGPFPRTGQKNGHIQLAQNKAIASGTTISADLMWPGDTPNPGRSKLFPVRGGDYYYFGGWVRWDAGVTLPGGVTGLARFLLNFYDSNGAFVSSATTNSVTSASGGQQFLNGTVRVPITAAFVQFDCNAQITTTGASFNTGSSGIYMDARFDDVFIYKATRSVHTSYRPLSNPLTGHDAGSSVTVNIASFTMRAGSTDLSISSGAITSLSYNTLYYVYFDDPDFVGGAEGFNATTVKETALQGEFRYFVGQSKRRELRLRILLGTTMVVRAHKMEC